jgi:tRNA A37 threonylcarbamoyladenosine modification protein TsaB
MFQAQLASLQQRFDIPLAAISELEGLLQQAATTRASVLTTLIDAPESVVLASLEEDERTEETYEWLPLSTLDRYEDLGLLGTGGMGEVRQVRDPDLGRTMAMKVIHAEMMDRPALLARFIE